MPAPPDNLKLIHIALGFGIQNYSCPSVGAEPKSTGALAMLYDITPLYPKQSAKSLSLRDFEGLPSQALWSHFVPLHFNQSSAGRVSPLFPGATTASDPYTPDAPLALGGRELPFLGHHFFDSTGIPTFVLDKGAIFLPSAKLNTIDAPTNADRGPSFTGAVAWLQLGAKDGAKGASMVYRVTTAGGNSHGCKYGTGDDSTSYSAMYWFYG